MNRSRRVNDWQHQRNVEEVVLVRLQKQSGGLRGGYLRHYLDSDHEFRSAMKRLEYQGRAQYVAGAGWVAIDRPPPREER